MAELTLNEKRLLAALAEEKKADAEHLASLLNATPEAVVQWGHLSEDKGLAKVNRITKKSFEYTEEGRKYLKNGLPEAQLYKKIKSKPDSKIAEFQEDPAFKIGFGQLRKNGLVKVTENGTIQLCEGVVRGDDYNSGKDKGHSGSIERDEASLKNPSDNDPKTKEFIKRGILVESETVRYAISITPEGIALVNQGLDIREEIGTLTRDQIISGAWKTANLRRYDVKKLPKTVYPESPTRTSGSSTRCARSFWRWALPRCTGRSSRARSGTSMPSSSRRTTRPGRCRTRFYLKEEAPLPEGWECLRDMHEHGGNTSSTGWGGKWNPEKAKQCVLRTHTTSLSIQDLATHPEPPVKAFCIGRVYRREAIDPTHTPEFEQLEGIVMDKEVNFRHLLGFLKEFYQRMGFSDVRLAGFFPYTEPSVEPEIWVDGLGWVEMGGAGVFREEVTDPWGVKCPVLAWGLGVSRVAMLRLGLKDLRQLYQSDLEWIRNTLVHAPAAAGRKT